MFVFPQNIQPNILPYLPSFSVLTLKPETKTVGIGSQILKELGLKNIRLLATPLKYPSLSGFDLEVIGFEQ